MQNEYKKILVIVICCLGTMAIFGQAQNYADNGWNLLEQTIDEYDIYVRAVEQFSRALEINPQYSDAYHGLAYVYFRLMQYEEAAKANRRALQLRPNQLQYLILELRILLQQGAIVEAREKLEPLLRDNDANTDVMLVLADVLYTEGRTQDAVETYRRVLDYEPYNLSALSALAYLSIDHLPGQNDEYVLRLLAVHSNEVMALLLATRYYLVSNDFERALFYARAAYGIAPKTEQVLASLTRVYLESRDFESALDVLNTLLNVNSENKLAWYGKGKLEQNLGMYSDALQAYNRALLLDPYFEPSFIAREELLSLLPPTEGLESMLDDYVERAKELQGDFQYIESELLLRRALRIDPYNILIRKHIASLYELYKNYPRYLNELQILKSLGDDSLEVSDAIEGLQEFLDESVSFENNIQQFEVPRARIPLHIFYTINTQGDVPGELQLYAWLLLQFLFSIERLDPIYYKDSIKNNYEALQIVGKGGDGMILILGGGSSQDIIILNSELISHKSGASLGEYQVTTQGHYAVEKALLQMLRLVDSIVPRIGEVIGFSDDGVVISLGTTDDIEIGSILDVYPQGSIELSAEAPYAQSTRDPIGEIEIATTDELISEGIFSSQNITNNVDIGQTVLFRNAQELEIPVANTRMVDELLNYRLLDNSLINR